MKVAMAAEDVSIAELIAKKRDGEELTGVQISQFVRAVMKKDLEQSQLGAMLMAIYMSGMTLGETVQLTQAIVDSGEVLRWPKEWHGLVVDKHSTGGVGDKVSLVLTPSLAACGLKVPMVSGRALGHTGGTLDKLESIPGFKVSQSLGHMQHILDKVGCCIVEQTDALVPADHLLTETRGMTSTVESIPLLAASMISKKAAERVSALVLDVKFGRGAFMPDEKNARELARTLVAVSAALGVVSTAVLSRMDQPLGCSVGNALEVAEAIETLHGGGPASLQQMVETLGGHLLHSVAKVNNSQEGAEMIRDVLRNGSAKLKFQEMIVAQGVDPSKARKLCMRDFDVFSILPKASKRTTLKAENTGYVHAIDPLACASVCNALGASRTKPGRPPNFVVGLKLHVELGSQIKEGDDWVTVHHEDEELAWPQIKTLRAALDIQSKPVPSARKQLVVDVITS